MRGYYVGKFTPLRLTVDFTRWPTGQTHAPVVARRETFYVMRHAHRGKKHDRT